MQVYGVVSFYHSVHHDAPRALTSIKVCMGTACFVCAAPAVLLAALEETPARSGWAASRGRPVQPRAGALHRRLRLAPAVVVNDEIQPGATAENVLRRVQALSGEEQE